MVFRASIGELTRRLCRGPRAAAAVEKLVERSFTTAAGGEAAGGGNGGAADAAAAKRPGRGTYWVSRCAVVAATCGITALAFCVQGAQPYAPLGVNKADLPPALHWSLHVSSASGFTLAAAMAASGRSNALAMMLLWLLYVSSGDLMRLLMRTLMLVSFCVPLCSTL